ncbi:hypothetical protein V5O48_013683 [Marasmius crinis-equi]|uniref:Uncharacterized protein n=1 Tax=Marasmius crinis-equi TaxID=585013 RepID=A0ABR3EZE7_9AGAR
MGFGRDVSDTFDVATKNIEALQKKAAVAGASETCSILTVSKLAAGTSLPKFRFTLFSKKSSSDIGEGDFHADGNGEGIIVTSVGTNDLEGNCKGIEAAASYTIENWPAPLPAVREALDGVAVTHDLNIPPFYDQHGMLISPTEGYRARLEGALVQIRFTLIHHIIGNKKSTQGICNVFVADIAELHVI